MGRFTEKQLTIMTIVVSVVISGLFAALIYRDLGTVDEEEQRIETTNANIRSAEIEISKMKSREDDVIVFREIVNRDAAVLPDESEINEFINIIGEYEKNSGVVVTQVTGLSSRGRKKNKEAILQIPLKLKLRGSIDQFLKFVNLFENHKRFVRISGFSISRGSGKSTGGEALHGIQLQIETYQYNAQGGPIARVEILNYERKKQDLSIQKRIRQSKKALIETYDMKPRISRRDPLADPRVAPQPVGEGDEMTAAERWKKEKQKLDELELEVTLLKDDVRVEKKLRDEHDFMRIAPVSKAIDQRIAQLDYQISEVLSNRDINIPELKDEFIKNVVQPYETVKEERKSGNGDAGVNVLIERKQVYDTLQKMRLKFSQHIYKDVINTYEGFLRFSEGRRLAPDAEPLREEMEELAQQAEIITKFENEPLNIEGTIIDTRRSSYAIINGQIVSEGEFVDQDRRIQIKEIHADQIHFVYETVPIIKYLRK